VSDEPGTSAQGGEVPADQVARAQSHASELSARLAAVAESIAESEDMAASTFEESARLRPHAADRLRGAAQDARDFAERERTAGHRLRHPRGDGSRTDDGGAPGAT